jgi:hypothetical protein
LLIAAAIASISRPLKGCYFTTPAHPIPQNEKAGIVDPGFAASALSERLNRW